MAIPRLFTILAVLAIVVSFPLGLRAVETWSVSNPATTDMLSQGMTVLCDGTTNATVNRNLLLRVYSNGTLKNHEPCSYQASAFAWGPAGVGSPAGGYGAGPGELKVFLIGDPTTATPLATQTFTFISP